MGFELERLNDTKVRLKVEIPAEEVDKALDASYAELRKVAKVDGFRKGKIPRHILEKYYGKSVEDEVLNDIVPKAYISAVSESGVNPVASPAIENQGLKVRKGKPLSFSATVEVRPEFKLGEYKGVEVKGEKAEVTDEDMEAAMKELRESNASLETVEEDRPAENGDFVVIDFEGFLGSEAFDGGKAKDYTLELGSGQFVPGFEEQVVGARKGDEIEVKVKFPEEYRSPKLKGQDAHFKVKVNEIKKKVIPEFDDELAKDMGIAKTADELKERIREELIRGKEQEITNRQRHEIIKKLVESHSFEVPLSMVDEEYRNLLVRQQQDIYNAGLTPQQAGFDMTEFEKQARPIAEERVRSTIILSKIAEQEEVVVSDEEMNAFLQTLSYQARKSVDELKELYSKRDGGLEELRSAIAEDKVMELLHKEAKKV